MSVKMSTNQPRPPQAVHLASERSLATSTASNNGTTPSGSRTERSSVHALGSQESRAKLSFALLGYLAFEVIFIGAIVGSGIYFGHSAVPRGNENDAALCVELSNLTGFINKAANRMGLPGKRWIAPETFVSLLTYTVNVVATIGLHCWFELVLSKDEMVISKRLWQKRRGDQMKAGISVRGLANMLISRKGGWLTAKRVLPRSKLLYKTIRFMVPSVLGSAYILCIPFSFVRPSQVAYVSPSCARVESHNERNTQDTGLVLQLPYTKFGLIVSCLGVYPILDGLLNIIHAAYKGVWSSDRYPLIPVDKPLSLITMVDEPTRQLWGIYNSGNDEALGTITRQKTSRMEPRHQLRLRSLVVLGPNDKPFIVVTAFPETYAGHTKGYDCKDDFIYPDTSSAMA